ncbi:hypothetical protein GALMADRAFT_78276 [Galerina marginata CBS 339.88]|uniref:Cytochrome P450 n=1 Tax=Galerina marginata (strain CBS 339.88) TaxID=685588 RepID=A0A067SLV0_GALM3|nr:hypothetical protein GALMADRAFT_78276 [Galerina marginata CBS 339.88]
MHSIVTFLAILIPSYFIYLWHRRSRRLPLPPGPNGFPLIGNASDIPHDYAWLTYTEWQKKYGEIVHLNVFGHTTIILNSSKAATELLEKRSFNYSDRPRMVMANELVDWDWDFAHMSYTDRWRRHRRSFHQYFQPRNLSSYYPSHKKAVITLLENFSKSPEEFPAHIRHYVASIVLRAAYGYEIQPVDDFYVRLVLNALEPLLQIVHAGNYLVEYIPALKHIPKWFPGAGFKRKAEVWAVGARALRDVPFKATKQAIADGVAQQSYVFDNLERLKAEGSINTEEEEVVRNCAAIMYLAGSDTTASLLNSFMLAMAHYPAVQHRAQADLDAVVGKSRLPDFSDREALPYIDAIISETMRWGPVTPLALPHRAISEDVYDGYRIPAGATITPNVWAILHDEEIYPEPFKFRPERFIQEGEAEVQADPSIIGAFGFGRRICPGRHLVQNTAWLSIASILSVYNISKPIDGDGKVVEPLIQYTDGLVSHPKPFKLQLTPRSGNVEKLIESARMELSV